MSDVSNYDDPDLDEADDDEPDEPEGQKRTHNGERFRRQREALKRENAFLKAGVDTDSAFGKLLLKNYEGELSRDAIAAYTAALRKELGATEATPETEATAETEPAATGEPAPEITPEVAASTAERRDLATDGVPDDGSGVDPRAASHQAFRDTLARGSTHDDAGAAAVRVLREAAAAGDQRVVWNPGATG